jgi:hypothetical protein
MHKTDILQGFHGREIEFMVFWVVLCSLVVGNQPLWVGNNAVSTTP